jgi:peptidoglycan/xylan/chitin deacetylase (PgdA/CDA1 family)
MIGRRHLKRLYYLTLHLLGRERHLISELKGGQRLLVLNLHQVSPRHNPAYPPIPPEDLDELIRFLKQSCYFAQLGVHNDNADRGHGERIPVILSFDDGLHDFVEYAAPILHRHGVVANQNVIIKCVETGQAPWNLRLYDFLAAAPLSLIREVLIPGFGRRLESKDPEAIMQYGLAVSRYLKNRSIAERTPLLAGLEEVMGRADIRWTRMMNTDDVRAMAGSHHIGAHSYSHESMGFESDAFFQEDFARCQAWFGRELKRPVETYAFPNGSYRQSHIEFLRSQACKNILVVDEKVGRWGTDVKPRITLSGESLDETRFLALGHRGRRAA